MTPSTRKGYGWAHCGVSFPARAVQFFCPELERLYPEGFGAGIAFRPRAAGAPRLSFSAPLQPGFVAEGA